MIGGRIAESVRTDAIGALFALGLQTRILRQDARNECMERARAHWEATHREEDANVFVTLALVTPRITADEGAYYCDGCNTLESYDMTVDDYDLASFVIDATLVALLENDDARAVCAWQSEDALDARIAIENGVRALCERLGKDADVWLDRLDDALES